MHDKPNGHLRSYHAKSPKASLGWIMHKFMKKKEGWEKHTKKCMGKGNSCLVHGHKIALRGSKESLFIKRNSKKLMHNSFLKAKLRSKSR